MTPSKEKKALPSSSSNTTVVPDQPTTYLQWQTTLQQAKVQYLQRQYKQCASRCTQLLIANNGKIMPLHKTFLHFYTALCYEALARSTHNLSATKLSTLHLARESYEAAAASLPRPAHLPATNDDNNDEEEGDSSASISDTASTTSSYSDTTSNTPSDDESPTSPHTTSPTPSRSSSFRTDKLKPSPLRIRKKAAHFPPTPSRPHLALFSPLPAHATYHYNTHLISFATMLQTHMHTVDALLHHTSSSAAQTQTHGRRSDIYSAGADGDMNAEDEERRARIERLRMMGWKRERFVPERYEELCARALAEL